MIPIQLKIRSIYLITSLTVMIYLLFSIYWLQLFEYNHYHYNPDDHQLSTTISLSSSINIDNFIIKLDVIVGLVINLHTG